MRFYYVNCDVDDAPNYCATLRDAKANARDAAENSYNDITVQRVEVDTDQATMLRLLNDAGGHTVFGDVVYVAKAGLKRGEKSHAAQV